MFFRHSFRKVGVRTRSVVSFLTGSNARFPRVSEPIFRCIPPVAACSILWPCPPASSNSLDHAFGFELADVGPAAIEVLR